MASPVATGAGLGSAAKPPSAATTPGWNQLVDAARKEGTLNLYGGQNPALRDAVVAPFEKAFPGIKINGTFAPGSQQVAKLLAEHQAKKLLADVILSMATEVPINLKPAGAVAPLELALVLPEVLNPSLWFQSRLWWLDAEKPYTVLAYQGFVGTGLHYNTKLVDPGQFRSYQDFLDPKWKGKIVSYDIRRPGVGQPQVRFIYRHAELGPKYLDKLYGEMGITVSSDHRQMVDWLGQGRYHVGLFIGPNEIQAGIDQGLPLGTVTADQFKEGALLITNGGGTVSIADSPPHPNAAQVFTNWVLSREGQISWQDKVKLPSLRLDIPKDQLDPARMPKPGVNYVDGGGEEFNRTSTDEIVDLVTKALEKAK